MNDQALCDYKGIFLDVQIWPGSIHDARFYANSNLSKMFTEKSLPMTYQAYPPGTYRIRPYSLQPIVGKMFATRKQYSTKC